MGKIIKLKNDIYLDNSEDVTNKIEFNGTAKGKVYKIGKVVCFQIYLYPKETATWGVLAKIPENLYPVEIADGGTTISGTECWVYGKSSVNAGTIRGTSTVGTPILLCGQYVVE